MFRMSDRSFEDLAMPLLQPLYNYARWLTKDSSEAEDLVQETYLKGLRGFQSFASGTNFKAWIYRILRNTFLTSRTGLRAAPQLSIEDDLDEVDGAIANRGVEAALIVRIDAVALRRAIDDLPLPFREVL